MCVTKIVLLFFGIAVISMVRCEVPESSVSDNIRQPKFGFLSGATNIISSMAQDLISRSTTSSQVLSLNLTNLVILFVLKAIIFGASNFGFGHSAHGRNADDLIHKNDTNEIQSRGLLSEPELLFILSFLQADSTQNYDCLHRLVCEDPSKAKEYLLAGKVFLKGTELFGSYINGARYEKILSQLQDAVSYGLNGQNCSARYRCNHTKR